MSGTSRQLQTIMVGVYPYILIEIKPGKSEDEEARIGLQAGGFGDVGEPKTAEEFVECIEELLDMMREAE